MPESMPEPVPGGAAVGKSAEIERVEGGFIIRLRSKEPTRGLYKPPRQVVKSSLGAVISALESHFK